MDPSRLPLGLRHRILEYVADNPVPSKGTSVQDSQVEQEYVNDHETTKTLSSKTVKEVCNNNNKYRFNHPDTESCANANSIHKLNLGEKFCLVGENSPGFIVRDSFLPDTECLGLCSAVRDASCTANLGKPLGNDGTRILLSPAKVGMSLQVQDDNVRGDLTAWISKFWHASQKSNRRNNGRKAETLLIFEPLFQRVKEMFPDSVMQELGIIDSHTSIQLALYPGNGEYYAEHRDSNIMADRDICCDRPFRKFTCLYYLNPQWKTGDGGELKLGENQILAPISNRFVVFRSSLLHQVLRSYAPRYAITFWFYSQSADFSEHISQPLALKPLPVSPEIAKENMIKERDDQLSETIFIAIPSYRDPQLQYTLLDAFNKAEFPDRIFAGVYLQCTIGEDTDARSCFPVDIPPRFESHIRVCMTDSANAKGPTYARHVAHSLYKDETYVLNIDSHSRFTQKWDTSLVGMLKTTIKQHGSEKIILTTYPAGFEIDPNCEQKIVSPNEHLLQYAGPLELQAKCFGEFDGMLRIKACRMDVTPDKPTLAKFWAAGFNFSKASVIQDVPYPPLEHLFFGEESLMASRLWTHGWDFFTPTRDVMFHCWSRSYRQTFSSPSKERTSALKWVRGLLNNQSECIESVNDTLSYAKYGLGNIRTLSDYELFCGVDFGAQTIE